MERKHTSKSVAVYQAKDGAIVLHSDKRTLWASQKDIAALFGVNVRTVSEHIRNIFKTKELDQKSVIRKFRITASDGKNYLTNHYNLDMVISVGYRVNSTTATHFRKWATQTLNEHITKGYTLNQKVIAAHSKKQFLADIARIQNALPPETMISADQVLELIKAFSGAWFSLASYDNDLFPTRGFSRRRVRVEAYDLYTVVGQFSKELKRKKQASDLFAREKHAGSLEGILGNVLQKAYDREMYPSIEEKAAHLLYFMVKNHPFADGNKRTGAFAFVWFLKKAQIRFERTLTPQALTAITLLVASSKPSEKDRIIGLILLMLHT